MGKYGVDENSLDGFYGENFTRSINVNEVNH